MTIRTTISEQLVRSLAHEAFLEKVCDFRPTPAHERLIIPQMKGVRAYWVAPHGSIEAAEIKAYGFEVPHDELAFHVFESSDLIEADALHPGPGEAERVMAELGRLESKIVPALRAAVHLQVVTRLVTLLHAAAGGTRRGWLDDLERPAEVMAAAGGQPVVVGWAKGPLGVRRLAEDSVQEYFWDGLVDRDDLSADEAATLPLDEVFLYERGTCIVGHFGGLLTKEWDEPFAWWWHVSGKLRMGAVVLQPPLRVREGVVANGVRP